MGLLDFLFGGGQPQAQTGQMPAGRPGQIQRGPDGQNYQYAQTTGMQGATGDNGWIRTNQQPKGGLFSGRLGVLNDPSVALPLAGALMQPGNLGANLGQGFALAGQGLETRKKQQKDQLVQNATANWLKAQNADPSLVELAQSGGGAQALQMWQATQKEQGLMAVGKNLYNKGTGEWIQAPAGMNGDDNKFYGNPIYTQDENGNVVPYQLSESGVPKKVELPAGQKIARGVDKIDAGTSWILIDKQTGNVVGTQPKDVAGEASQKVQGAAQGEAQYALPAAKLSADTAIAQADQLINDPYLPSMVGPANSKKWNMSADSQRVQGKMDQLSGGAFLQARQALKGGGAITDMEGQRAEAALVRANAAQSIEDYKTAIEEYKTHLRNGFAILEQQARGGGAAQPVAPQQGTTSTNVPFRVVQ